MLAVSWTDLAGTGTGSTGPRTRVPAPSLAGRTVTDCPMALAAFECCHEASPPHRTPNSVTLRVEVALAPIV